MNVIQKARNYRLIRREKFGTAHRRQITRLVASILSHPLRSFRQGVLKVMLGVTYRCQCDCIYCCSSTPSKFSGRYFSTPELYSLITQIASLPSLFTAISFFGGEPMLRDDIGQLILYAARRGLFTEMDSNGILLSRDNVLKLKQAGLHHVFINLKASNAAQHDSLSRSEGVFQKAIEAIRHCVREKLPCSISITALKESIRDKELEKVIRLGRELRVASVRILYPMPAGKWNGESQQVLTDNEKKYVRVLLRPDFVYLESTAVCAKEIEKKCFFLRKKFFYITPLGEVWPCPFVPLTLGIVGDKPLSGIVDEMWKNELFKERKNCQCFAC